MKLLLTIIMTSAYLFSIGQTANKAGENGFSEEVRYKLQKKLNASRERVDEVLNVVSKSNQEMSALAKDKGLRRDAKTIKFKRIAEERDSRIKMLLTSDQIDILINFMMQLQRKRD